MTASGLSPASFRSLEAGLNDPSLRQKIFGIPQIIDDWLAPYGGLQGRRVLDFGCGFGETAAGMALGFDSMVVDGVDTQPKPVRCAEILRDSFGLESLPDTLQLRQIEPGASLGQDKYDLLTSWSVVEHVRRGALDTIISGLFQALKPGGLAFIQISPLYFSPEGSHLWALGYLDWQHLTKQVSEVLADIAAADHLPQEARERLVDLFTTLNRVTADEIKGRFEAAGFEVLREQRDMVDRTPPADLLEAYRLDALKTFQIVLLMRRPLDQGGQP